MVLAVSTQLCHGCSASSNLVGRSSAFLDRQALLGQRQSQHVQTVRCLGSSPREGTQGALAQWLRQRPAKAYIGQPMRRFESSMLRDARVDGIRLSLLTCDVTQWQSARLMDAGGAGSNPSRLATAPAPTAAERREAPSGFDCRSLRTRMRNPIWRRNPA